MTEPAVRFDEVTVRRSGRTILDAVDWLAARGEHWALLGPNGAGKTTALRIASAQMRPTRGRAFVLGGRLGGVSMPELRRRIGVVEPALGRRFYPVQTACEVVASGFAGIVATSMSRWPRCMSMAMTAVSLGLSSSWR